MFSIRIKGNEVEIEKLRAVRNKLMDQRQIMINKREEHLIQNSSQKENIDQLRTQIAILEAKIANLKEMRNEFLQQISS